MKLIYLDRNEMKKAGVIIDIKDYYSKYSLEKRNNTYSMMQNAPIIMNVDGVYISLTKLVTLEIKDRYVIEEYLREMRNPITDKKPFLCFRWK